jgi:hypothetical protein
MKARSFNRVATPARRPGTYLCCGNCGRLLNIQWATRSIVCSCGAKVDPGPGKPGEPPSK